VEVHGTKYGMFLENVSVGMVLSPNCPVVLRTIGANETPIHQLARDDQGLYLESVKDAKAQRSVGLTLDGLKLYQGGIAGNERTRGSAVLSGDGKTTEFAVKFPAAHPAAPFIVASSNQRIGMGVERVAADGFTAGFAAPPPAGKDNVIVTWMVQE